MKFMSTLVAAASVVVLATSAQAAEQYRLGGGPAGGGWHPAVSAGAALLNSELGDKYNFNYSPSNGSVDNVRRVSLGDFDTAWGHIGQIFQSWNGVGLFEKDGATKDFRLIANVRQQTQIIAVLADSPIKTYSDMKGKIVNLLNKGSGSNVNCNNIMAGAGILDEIEVRNLGFSDSARALGDRQIDVFCSAGAPFTIPALTQLSITKPVRYISLTDAEQAAVIEKSPFYAPVTIPVQPDVKGMTEPAKTIGYDVFWMVNKSVSDEAVYDMLKVAADPANLEKLSATAAYWRTLSGNFENLKPLKISVHPAAAKYWEERGVAVPAEVVQGY
jgi:TRAP transporter TAXI family solute receptor